MTTGSSRIFSATRIQILLQVTTEKTRMEMTSTISRKLVPQRGWKRTYFAAFSGVSSSPAS